MDDDPSLLELTGEVLQREDDRLVLETATGADEGLDQIGDRPPDCIISDFDMPGSDGIEFLRAVRETYPDLPFILFTGKGSESVASDAMAAGVTDYLQKGSGIEQYELLANRITNAIEAQRVTQEAARQEELMRLTELAADTGGWELDLETEELRLTEGTRRLTNISPENTLTLDEAFDLYHPDDRDEVQTAVNKTVQTGEQTSGTWRLRPRGSEEERLVDVTITPVKLNGDVTTLRGAVNDVTDIWERDHELEYERQFIEQSLDALNDLFYVLNTDGTIRRWNDRVVDVTGYAESELSGMDANKMFPEDEQENAGEAIKRTLTGDRVTVEADLQTSDDDRIPYEWTGSRLTDPDGETTGIVGIGRDLTERRQRERRFQALVENSNDSISIVDNDGRFQYQSPSVEHILGYNSSEIVGDIAWEYIHPDDREAVKEAFSQWTEDSGATELIEYRARHADGSWRWLEARGTEQFDNPAVDGYVINSRDITEYKEHERELNELREQYQSLVENFPGGGLFLFDENLQFVHAGGKELAEVGLSSAELKGTRPHDTFPEEIADEHVDYFEKTLDGESHTYYQEYQGLKYEIRTMPIQEDTGEITYGMTVSRNISQQVEQKRDLKRQNERLEEFTSVVSHDLRNPLQIAIGRLELAQKECDSPHLDDIADALDRSQALIDDLLTLARGGNTVGSTETVSVSALAEECWQVIPDNDTTLDIRSHQTVTADRSRLQQLLENLLANAVEHGGTNITVSVGSLANGFYVADNGTGIPDEERDSVFEAGYSTTEDGTGFGLRIVKQIVDAHGWEIEIVESHSGGAQFEVTGADILE
ncbi:PAS domain S-box protein [Halorubrum sp. BOL3-1]|uniref:PAS domain S-box protein n=1 Tax=Halorubrum sp. BOL3-1 TaxID=2497325 RepID=UPI001F4FE19D|nr:PAS domain S-box protein [Halorubrum sp. BOL3-1]